MQAKLSKKPEAGCHARQNAMDWNHREQAVLVQSAPGDALNPDYSVDLCELDRCGPHAGSRESYCSHGCRPDRHRPEGSLRATKKTAGWTDQAASLCWLRYQSRSMEMDKYWNSQRSSCSLNFSNGILSKSWAVYWFTKNFRGCQTLHNSIFYLFKASYS